MAMQRQRRHLRQRRLQSRWQVWGWRIISTQNLLCLSKSGVPMNGSRRKRSCLPTFQLETKTTRHPMIRVCVDQKRRHPHLIWGPLLQIRWWSQFQSSFNREKQGETYCLTYSLSSALSYIREDEAATLISAYAPSIDLLPQTQVITKIRELMGAHLLKLGHCQVLVNHISSNKAHRQRRKRWKKNQ